MWMTTATDHIHQIGRAHGSQGQAGSLGETVSLSRLDSLCESQVPAGWRPAILREASTGGTESPDCWEITPALINQGAVSSAPDIYQTSFTLICQCAVGQPLQGTV